MFYTIGIRGALTLQTKPHVFVWNMFGDLEIRLPFLIPMDNMDLDIDESAISMDFEQVKFEFQ